MKRTNNNLTVQMSNCRNAHVYGRIAQSFHRLNKQLYERLCVVEEDKISRLSVNQLMPNTNETGTAVNGSAQIPSNADKLVVTIPEDLPLDDHERPL